MSSQQDPMPLRGRGNECATLDAVEARLVLGITIRERLVGIDLVAKTSVLLFSRLLSKQS